MPDAWGRYWCLGDFNARIHARMRGEEGILGPHIYGGGADKISNLAREQGDRTNMDLMIDMCTALGLKVMSTWFEQKEANQVTHRAPGGEKLPPQGEAWDPAWFASLDLCLALARWSGVVKDAEPQTTATINADQPACHPQG